MPRELEADGACLASWADATQMIGQKKPVVADMVVATMAQEAPPAEQCLLRGATDRLDKFLVETQLAQFEGGQPEPEVGEPGEWRHGWQTLVFFRL